MSYRYPVYIVLADIRSAENVGAIFRTADATGITEIILSGYTPAPVDRFGRAQGSIHKAALGAETWVPWRSFETHEACVAWLKAQAVALVVVEQTPQAVSYRDYQIQSPSALIFGNEITGVPREYLSVASAELMIPMEGKKESLNVSVAAGIVLFGLSSR